jgi:serine/threonine protein kinase
MLFGRTAAVNMQTARCLGIHRRLSFILQICIVYESKAVSLDNFLLKRTLGIGSFGRVVLVQHDQTATYMAMKILEKIRVRSTCFSLMHFIASGKFPTNFGGTFGLRAWFV